MDQVAGSLSNGMETLSHVFRLVDAFRAFDADNDGHITTAQLGGIMASLGYCCRVIKTQTFCFILASSICY